jgi:Derlin-2/3
MRRTFATGVLVTSIACHMKIVPYAWVYFHYLELFRLPPQVWRLVTSFLLSSPQLGIVMDTYFVFQYASQLETTHPKFGRKEDLLWYLVFCGAVIIVRPTLSPSPPPQPQTPALFLAGASHGPTLHLLYLPG